MYRLTYWDVLPSVLSPGLEVNWATSTIFTANCCPVSLLMHLLTTLKGPLKTRGKEKAFNKCFITPIEHYLKGCSHGEQLEINDEEDNDEIWPWLCIFKY